MGDCGAILGGSFRYFWCSFRRGLHRRYIFGRAPYSFHGCVPLASFVRFLRRLTAFRGSGIGLPCGSSLHRRLTAFSCSGIRLPCRSRLIGSGSSSSFGSRFLCGGTAISSVLHGPQYSRAPTSTGFTCAENEHLLDGRRRSSGLCSRGAGSAWLDTGDSLVGAEEMQRMMVVAIKVAKQV
jgi:hypothetical protein